MKLAVTGASGYLGGKFVRDCEARGIPIVTLGRGHSDAQMVERLGELQPTCVVHFASVFIGEHRSDQVEVLIRSNIEFGSRVLEAMKNVGCRAFVTAGSAWQDFEESGRPANLYAATKNAFAEIVKYYIDAYEMTSIELRIFDSAGPDDTRGKLLSFLAQNLDHAGVSLSPGEQKLHIVHVDDVVEAFRLAAERATSLQAGTRETFYLKSKQAMSLKEILQKFQAKTGERPTVHWGAKPYRFREVMDPYDGGPTLPNWQPKYDLNQILDELLNPNKP